jgi:hypothetical protein
VREQEATAMNRQQALTSYILLACTLVLTLVARATENPSGNWTMHTSTQPGKVEFGLISRQHGGYSHHETDWPLSAFQGLDAARSGKQEVKFTITRDAGRFDCNGYLENGDGAGIFHFTPDTNFAPAMKSLGFSEIDGDKQYLMAVLDVSLDFVRKTKGENLQGLNTDQLIAFRIHGVTPDFIDAIRAAGLSVSDSDQLVAFRIHGVTPDMIHALRQQGYQPDADNLVAMRIHGATPEWVEALKKLGYDQLDFDDLIAFRIHGVSPDFIQRLATLGYKHPGPHQLVTMRIHGVSPEYISQMKSRGLNDLTIDQLVEMRVHGID